MATKDELLQAKILQINGAEQADSVSPQLVGETFSLVREIMKGQLLEKTASEVAAVAAQVGVKPVGFSSTAKPSHIMLLVDGAVTWVSGGNSNNVCGTIPVSAGDVVYVSSYNIGSYESLPWAILGSNNQVLQHADENITTGVTPTYRIDVEADGTLYVYMQYNADIPVVTKATSQNVTLDKVDTAIKTTTTFSEVPEVATVQTGVYIDNKGLEKGHIEDAIYSGGNTNNGVYSIPVNRGDVIKIVNACLGGYGNAYWTLLNSEGIVQRGSGSTHSLLADTVVICQATGTLYASFGYYNSQADTHPKPSFYRAADLNARSQGVTASLSLINARSLHQAIDPDSIVTGKYLTVEDGVLSFPTGGNTNNGYMVKALTKGTYVKVSGASSSAFSFMSWALTDGDGVLLKWSGNIDYRQPGTPFELIADSDCILYLGFGYYDEAAEEYPRPIIEALADSGAAILRHDAAISAADKVLFRQIVEFDGFDAPKVLRYVNDVLTLDTTIGNSYFRCFHLAVHKGEKFMLRHASTGGYSGLAWAIFSGGVAVQQSSRQEQANTVFADSFIEVQQDGTLWVNNFRTIDDENCELYRLSDSELDANLGTKAIVICGDSTAQGLGESLEGSMLNTPRRIFRMGVGSENVFATAARMGAIPCLVMPVTIPATATAVEVQVTPRILFKQGYGTDGVPSTPAPQNQFTCPMFVQTNHFYCSIAGVEGDLYTSTTDDKTYFLRSSAGSAVTLKEPTEIVPQKVQRVRSSLLVCLMGTNGGYLNYNASYVADNDLRGNQTDEQRAANLFDVMKRMFSYMAGEMIVIGFFCGDLPTYYTKAFYEKYESLCEHEFGERFINARLWLKDYCWKEMGLTLTSADKASMAAGYPPLQLFDDNQAVHLKTATNGYFARYVADRISHLGY